MIGFTGVSPPSQYLSGWRGKLQREGKCKSNLLNYLYFTIFAPLWLIVKQVRLVKGVKRVG